MASSTATADERYLLDLVNATRTARGLQPLELERHLNASAERHSKWMLREDVFSHTGQGGSSVSDRVRATGFEMTGSWMVAENLAYVSIDGDGSLRDEVRQLHQNLMNSSGHRANILSERADLVGIGLEVGQFNLNGRDYKVLMLTQNFAATGGRYDIDIARGITISKVVAPDLAVAGPDRALWERGADGATLRGEGGGQALRGTARADDLQGTSGAERISGLGGSDWIAGGGGNDTIRGGAGHDMLLGQGGNDRMMGSGGNDSMSGGAGRDYLSGGSGRDVLQGGSGADTLRGGSGDDRLSGGSGNDLLRGDAGRDLLLGGRGHDELIGGSGHDTLVGGSGNDILRGGAGIDSFVFHRSDGRDRIHGYEAGRDRILIAEAAISGTVADFVEDHILQRTDSVIIRFDARNRVVISGEDLTVADIADDIFIF